MPSGRPSARIRLAAFAAVLTVTPAVASRAQCPSGTPPPCASQRVALAARTTVPALDDRTWIVVPFDNASHGADTEWLRDASVNLLYLDLSRWRDIRVVDDKRVADFMRGVPGATGAQKLSLNDGLAVARRAGAGRLVMGDVLKIGSRTTFTATVFDVRHGSRLRSAHEETAVQDSIMPLFGKLARSILAVAPPKGVAVGTIGTTSVAAYQEYLAGLQALNRFDASAAKRAFQSALTLDTAFALAHYKLAVTSVYDEAAAASRVAQVRVTDTLLIQRMVTIQMASDAANSAKYVEDPVRLAHANAAARLSGSLPPRERSLINGLLAQAKGDYARACALYDGLVRADSSDVEALFGLGACRFQDDDVEAVNGDTTQLRFRSSWSSSLHLLRRALRVDPSFHLAFDDVLSMLTAPVRLGCRRSNPSVPCDAMVGPATYRGVVRRSGDSLLIVPVRLSSATYFQQQAEAEQTRTRRLNLEEARGAAEEWVAAAPRESRAHKVLAHVLVRLGRLDEADAELTEALADPAFANDFELSYERFNLLVKRHRAREFNHVLDSMNVAWSTGLFHGAVSTWRSLTGRLVGLDSFATTMLTAMLMPPQTISAVLQGMRVTLGVGGDSAVLAESRMLNAFFGGKCGSICLGMIGPNLKFGLRLPRAHWPVIDSAGLSLRGMPALALSRGDTARLRRAARVLDSLSMTAAQSGVPEDGTSAIAADAYLVLGDSLRALNALRRMLDTTLVVTPLETLLPGGGLVIAGMLWPRAMLQRADLAAALKEKEEAQLWYGRFVELWAQADPEFQPIVERARRARRAP